jgi:hypothetical protein
MEQAIEVIGGRGIVAGLPSVGCDVNNIAQRLLKALFGAAFFFHGNLVGGLRVGVE